VRPQPDAICLRLAEGIERQRVQVPERRSAAESGRSRDTGECSPNALDLSVEGRFRRSAGQRG
jgi:hypothetical protein